jgi:hypothetical protein
LPAAAALAVAVAAVAWRSQPPPRVPLDGWDVPELARHLRGRGLGLCVIPAHRGGPPAGGAFLARSARPWEELAALPRDPARIDSWAGVVYCERVRDPGARAWLAGWWGEGCCLEAGPFLFFGDCRLLEDIAGALRDAPTGKP